MSMSLRVVHVNTIPALAEKLGVLATVEVLDGPTSALEVGEFEDPASGGRWRLTSVAHGDPASIKTLAVGFKRLSGSQDLSVGMTLRRTVG